MFFKCVFSSFSEQQYFCTKNIKSLIDSHNQKILQDEKTEAPVKACNCQRHNKPNCPLKGECEQKDVIYHAELKNGDEVRK